MNITWKDFADSKRAYVDRGYIMVYNDDGDFVVEIQSKRLGFRSPIILKPFKTETEAMIKAHMLVENHRHDLFQFRSFRKLQKDTVGYKAVILYSPACDFFTSRILKVTIPKGTIIHFPDAIFIPGIQSEFKYRSQDAIINYVVDYYNHTINDIEDGDVLLSAHCCSKVLGPYRDACDGYEYLHLCPDKFIEQVKNRGGVYSECMSIHIPDFSWDDTACGEGFHYFLTYDEARRYSARFAGMISTLNRYVNKSHTKEANNG